MYQCIKIRNSFNALSNQKLIEENLSFLILQRIIIPLPPNISILNEVNSTYILF